MRLKIQITIKLNVQTKKTSHNQSKQRKRPNHWTKTKMKRSSVTTYRRCSSFSPATCRRRCPITRRSLDPRILTFWISFMNWVNRWLSLKWIMIMKRTESEAKVWMSCKRRSTRSTSEDGQWTRAAMMRWRWKALRQLRGNWMRNKHRWCNPERCWILSKLIFKLIQMKLRSWRKSRRMEGINRYRVIILSSLIAIKSYSGHRVLSRIMTKSITPSRMPSPAET